MQQAANVLAGYSLGDADLLRRAMGKKDKEKMAKERKRFVEGCLRVNQIQAATADAIFDFIAKFAEYGFNKSHSAAYGWISYQTAFVKAHYPLEFMAALLTHDASTTERLAEVIGECSAHGHQYSPAACEPRRALLHSEIFRDVRAIRFGLGLNQERRLGRHAVGDRRAQARRRLHRASRISARALDSRTVNRKILESLVKCGAFDEMGKSRAQLFTEIEQAMQAAAGIQRDRASGQGALFGGFDMAPAPNSAADHRGAMAEERDAVPTKKNSSDFMSPATRWKPTRAISTPHR